MNPKNSEDLFNKIRSQFSNIRLGDENGAATADPSSAVFFEFEFQEDADTFGSVSISLADGENMKVYYNRDLVSKIDEDSKDEWYAFLKELKDFAVEHQLTFDVRDITKNNLTKQDYENLADTNKTVNTDEMSEELARITKLAGVNEGLTGSAKRSYENLDKTKLIIRHKGKVDETVPGARSRQIQSLYIENEDGERFKYPLTHLAGARAMMRHVANGGRPHDEFGEHIIQTSEDIAKLQSFSRYVSNKDQLNDNAGDIIENTKLQLENLREYMRNLSKQSHYESSCKSYKKAEDQVLDDETVNKLREKFTMTNLDKRVEDAFPLINKVMAELENAGKEEQVNELEPDAEPIDAPVEPPVDHGAIVQSFLNDPDSKLVLRKDDTADKMLKTTKFTDKNTMLSSILSDIASRLLTKSGEEDRLANFASRVADEMEQEKSATFKPTPDYMKNKKIAIQLAKRYIDDYKKMQADPEYGKEVRMDPGAFAPKKDLKGKAKETEAFESWVDSMIDEGGIKPYVSMSRSEATGKMTYNVLDRNEKTIFSSVDQEEAQDFLRQNFDKLRAGEMKVAEDEEALDEYAKTDFESWLQKTYKKDVRSLKPQEYSDMVRKYKQAKERESQMQKAGILKKEGMGDKIADMAQSMSKEEFMSKADELGLSQEEAAEHYEKMQGGAHAGKFEGNMFAQAVQKAKAAGMKAGDKFKVGDQEYTLKDAIELAGLQLEEFFSEDDNSDYIKQAYMLAVKHHTDGGGDGNINEDIGDLIEDYNEKATKKITPEQIMRISEKYNAGGDYVEVLSAEGIDGKLWLEVAKKHYAQLESVSEDSHDDWSKLTNALIKRYGEDKAKVITDFAQISTDSGPELMKDHGLTPKNDTEEDMEQYFKKFPYLRKMSDTSWMDRLINIAGEGPDYGTPVSEENPELARIKNLAFYQ